MTHNTDNLKPKEFNITLDLLLSSKASHLIDAFATLMRVSLVFFSDDGKVLKRGRDFDNSKYCDYTQKKYFSLEECSNLDIEQQNRCRKTHKKCRYSCHANLNEIIAPIIINEDVAGFIIIGQFRTDNNIPKFIEHDLIAQKYFMELPYYSDNEVHALEEMFQLLIDYIINKELIAYNGNLRYQKILTFLDEHISKNITLKDLARHLAISPSSLVHFLHDHHQCSFKQLLIQKRLTLAETIWKKQPNLTISEVASQVGYEDHHYFSRLYSKHRGFPPGEFKRKFKSKNL